MTKPDPSKLTRREQQIMDILYARKRATAADVQEGLPDPPSYSSVRAMLARLETKGFIRHYEEGRVYVYEPVENLAPARRRAVGRLVQTFFGGSPAQAIQGLLNESSSDLSEEELAELAAQIEAARRGGR